LNLKPLPVGTLKAQGLRSSAKQTLSSDSPLNRQSRPEAIDRSRSPQGFIDYATAPINAGMIAEQCTHAPLKDLT
jgi:hypothetical protein